MGNGTKFTPYPSVAYEDRIKTNMRPGSPAHWAYMLARDRRRRRKNQHVLSILRVASLAEFTEDDLPYAIEDAELVSVADTKDEGAATYSIGLTITGEGSPALTLAQTTGLTGSGDGTDTLSYTGTIANINAALDGMEISGVTEGGGNILVEFGFGSVATTSNVHFDVVADAVEFTHSLVFSDSRNSMYLHTIVH